MRLAFALAVMLALLVTAGSGAQAFDSVDDEFSVFPTYVWISPFVDLPEDYTYWTTGHSRYRGGFASCIGESGIGIPSVTRLVRGPGTVSASFYFYDDEDNCIGSTSACMDVDEFGLAVPVYRDSLWSDNYWGSSRYSQRREKSVYDYPWPEMELSVKLTGSGPWTAECSVAGNVPDKWITGVEWDLNHDGCFNMETGGGTKCRTTLTVPGRYIFDVRVTDSRGYTTTATAEFVAGNY